MRARAWRRDAVGTVPLDRRTPLLPPLQDELPWADFAFAVDVNTAYERKHQALAVYQSIFQVQGDHLLTLYEAEYRYYGRLLGVAYAEIFRSTAPLLVEGPTVFLPVSRANRSSSGLY